MIEYSIALILGYAIAKWATPIFPSIKSKVFHLHHWIWSSIILLIVLWQGWDYDWVVGLLVGISLQGLYYKNWRIFRTN